MNNVIPLPAAVTGEVVGADVGALSADFPDWEIAPAYVAAASGPDARFFWARRDRLVLTSWSAAGLAAQLREHQ